MEKRISDAERILGEIKLMLQKEAAGRKLEHLSFILVKIAEYGEAKYKEGIEDAIEADVHPDIDEEMRAQAEEYHEARMEPYS